MDRTVRGGCVENIHANKAGGMRPEVGRPFPLAPCLATEDAWPRQECSGILCARSNKDMRQRWISIY